MTNSESPQQAATLVAIEQALQQAIASQRAGLSQDAEKLYRAILQIQPNHPEANHNMGGLAVQMKQPAAGLPYFMAALEADPARGQYWLSYIDALFQAGQLDDARQVLEHAQQQGLQGDGLEALALRLKGGAQIAEQPNAENQQISSESLPVSSAVPQNSQKNSKIKPADRTTSHLTKPAQDAGQVTGYKPNKSASKSAMHKGKTPSPQEIKTLVALFNQGRLTEAATLAQTMTARFPLYGFGWKLLGVVYQNMGRNADALSPMQKAIALSPSDAEAHNNLGLALKEMGRLGEAEASFRRALKINPGYAEAHNSLGVTLQDLGRLDEAEASYRRALQINPGYTEAHNNMGVTLQYLGRLDEAEASCRRALQINPGYAKAHFNLASVIQGLGRLNEAEANYRRALQINPDITEAHYNLGVTLKDLGRLDEAEASYRQALQIKPDYADAHINLGNTLQDMGRLDEAEASYRQALQIKPVYDMAHSNLLFCLIHNATVDAEPLFAEHLRFGEQFEAPLRASWPKHSNSRDPERCLQVGFVSADLCDHAVASFIEPVLAHLAGYPQLSLHAYSNNAIEDSVTQRLRGYLKHWHQITGLSDAVLAEKIRADGIDILMDLSGHTAKNRLLTFARKPAPVQASWMGYPGTTGLSAMDYYLSDRFMLPEGKFDDQFTEKIVRLPANAPFLPSKDAPPVNTLPALSNGYVTFGSFNRPSKLSRSVIALWSQLLRALPDSRMLLGAMPQNGKNDTLIDWFAQEGIARERLSFHARCGMDVYLGLHQQVDICLDTFPYNGGTTTCHALWMGIPTLTLAGDTLPGRVGAGILGHVGLEAFVAHDAADFVQKGLSWAGNLADLANLRAGLRERFAQSAAGQPALIAAGLERALRIMWQRWCAGLPPESFEVSLQDVNGITQGASK